MSYDPQPAPVPGPPQRPVTHDAAEAVYRTDLAAARDRYAELSDRDLSATAAKILRERGEFDPASLGHQLVAAREPLSAAERLEHLAIGEVLARYYRHPSMLDQAVRADASWEQIGAACGTSAGQARADYRRWADGQHHLLAWTEGRIGMSDAEYAQALARAAETAACSGGTGAAGHIGIQAGGKVLCAHADQDGRGMHWKLSGQGVHSHAGTERRAGGRGVSDREQIPGLNAPGRCGRIRPHRRSRRARAA
jgi:hypothetical protein